jgi:hypothetical protein
LSSFPRNGVRPQRRHLEGHSSMRNQRP